jgi:DNA-binding NtrC family response regulator
MPAHIVVVLDEPGLADKVVDTFLAAGYDAIAFPDPMAAMDALQQAEHIDLLITCPEFKPGKPTGISLSRMARHRRRSIKTLFIGPGHLEQFTQNIGVYLATPVTLDKAIERAFLLLDAGGPTHPTAV